ncbi:MAG: prepilin-type N-terminal cleavage/methylation domain-containing protein, partial [Myxococcota bacterium]
SRRGMSLLEVMVAVTVGSGSVGPHGESLQLAPLQILGVARATRRAIGAQRGDLVVAAADLKWSELK